MNCPHCKSLMAETDKSSDPGSEQVRFECPVCSSVALSIRPIPKKPGTAYPAVRLAGDRQFRF